MGLRVPQQARRWLRLPGSVTSCSSATNWPSSFPCGGIGMLCLWPSTPFCTGAGGISSSDISAHGVSAGDNGIEGKQDSTGQGGWVGSIGWHSGHLVGRGCATMRSEGRQGRYPRTRFPSSPSSNLSIRLIRWSSRSCNHRLWSFYHTAIAIYGHRAFG